MSSWQRMKNILIGMGLMLVALILSVFPDTSANLIAAILCLTLVLYGVRMLWYYTTIARHMVGGKAILYRSLIILDLAIFTAGLSGMSSFVIMLYLMGIYGFSGAISVLRALEAKRFGARAWKGRLVNGIISLIFTVTLLCLGLIAGTTELLIYGYSISLLYSAVMRIIAAFRKTAMVYIQ